MSESVFRVDPPDWVLTNPRAFLDWMTYQAPWQGIALLPMATCPLCRGLVFDDFPTRNGHAEWHLRDYFEAAPVPHPAAADPSDGGQADG